MHFLKYMWTFPLISKDILSAFKTQMTLYITLILTDGGKHYLVNSLIAFSCYNMSNPMQLIKRKRITDLFPFLINFVSSEIISNINNKHI